jgi:tetratricopeptide (TPR) repeat protein
MRVSAVRRWLPWLLALVIVAVSARTAYRAFVEDDLVAVAGRLRVGDPEREILPDPRSALEVLEDLLAEEPDNYGAWLETALAWQDLRSWDNAVEALARAADCAEDQVTRLLPMSRARDLLSIAGRYDDAVAIGEQIVELLPGSTIRRIQLGAVHYRGSTAAQELALARLVDPLDKRMEDLEEERLIEAFVTDLWGHPQVEELVDELMPAADPVLRQEVAESLTQARERFGKAAAALSEYADYGGFDGLVAPAWARLLRRTGRLYDAHLVSAFGLREPKLPLGLRRDFLVVQAECSEALGDHSQAADRYEQVLAEHLAAGARPPYLTAWDMYANRILAEDWEWILEHAEADGALYGRDAVLRWAVAAALTGTGRRDEARSEILEPFNAVALGTKTFTPVSLRMHPDRRRSLAMLAYELFDEVGDSRAVTALDAVLAQIPDDVEVLRLRADRELAQQRYDAATADAFGLLTHHRRDRADFDRWIEAADALSIQRQGVSLERRASTKVHAALTWQRSTEEAEFAIYKALGLRPPEGRTPRLPNQLHIARDPALSFAIVEELVRRGEIERARVEMRKLAEAFPEVQEFRLRLGRLLVREGQYAAAQAEFQTILVDVPDDREVLDLSMRTYRAMGAEEQANALLDRLMLDDPTGFGALQHGHRLLEEGRPDEAQRMVERLAAWTDLGEEPDTLDLAARVRLAMGEVGEAEAILNTLAIQHPEATLVALLGLDIGIESGQPGLVDAAVEALVPHLPEMLPDQMLELVEHLDRAGRPDAIAALFDESVASLPAAQGALPLVAAALKSQGQLDAADRLLALMRDQEQALLDRFLLLALQRRHNELGLRLKLDPLQVGQRPQVRLCLLVADVLTGMPALMDAVPLQRLRELGLGQDLEQHELELLDAMLRLLPAVHRLDELRPAAARKSPASLWPQAAPDVARVLQLAETDPRQAGIVAETLIHLALMDERWFWRREVRQLAENALASIPELEQPRRVLAADALREGHAEEAISWVQPLLLTGRAPLTVDLDMLLQATRAIGRGEVGVATALFFESNPDVVLLLAETLAAWGEPMEARRLFRQVLEALPQHREAQIGLIRTLSTLRSNEELLTAVEEALSSHPDDRELVEVVADALAGIARPPPQAAERMRELFVRYPDLYQLGEAIARAELDDPAVAREMLETLVARLETRSGQAIPETLPLTVVRAERTAYALELPDLAHALGRIALRLNPGSLPVYRDMATLELDRGELEAARRYLKALSFLKPGDRETSLQLAQLDFQQLGHPVRAAEVVRRTYPGTKPIEAIQILSAEAYLHGHPAEALNLFYAVARNPLISGDTYLTVARIAYASGEDLMAKLLYQRSLELLPADDARRGPVDWLLKERLATVEPAASAAQDGPAVAVDG